MSPHLNKIFPYLNLTKPRISLLFAITGLAALMVEGTLLHHPWRLWVVVLAIFMTGGSANAFNQYFEREIDKKMTSTAARRPLPQGEITPKNALIFSIVLGIAATLLLLGVGGFLSASFALGTIIFYSFFYTLYLKPRTPYNIVIGGAAGAMAPLIGWAAATGTVNWVPCLMFLIIFLWTPPHFWALALSHQEDYANVGLPMLPNVAGEEATRKQILYYSFSLIPLPVLFCVLSGLSSFFLFVCIVLSLLFVLGAYRLYRRKELEFAKQLFGYSIFYLLALFLLIILDISLFA